MYAAEPGAKVSPFLCALPAMALAIVFLIPFLNKAYLVDDPFFLMQAEQVAREFGRPLHFDLCWGGEEWCGKASANAPGAALMGYALLPVVWMGSPEWLAHLLQLGFLCSGILATVGLGIRWGFTAGEARLTGILLVAFPPVLALTDTATPDILAMSLGAIGIYCFVIWRGEKKYGYAAGAMLALGLAPYARAHLLMLPGAVGVWVLFEARTERGRVAAFVRQAWPLMGAGLVFAGLVLLTRETESHGVLPPARNLGAINILPSLRSYFWYLVCPFPIALVWLIVARRLMLLRYAGAAVVAAAVARFWAASTVTDTVLAALATVGLNCLVDLGLAAWNLKCGTRVLLLAWILTSAAVAPYVQYPPKYLLAAAPALSILIPMLLRQETRPARLAILRAGLAGCLALSLLVLHADAGFAEMPRAAAKELIAPRVAAGERVWFVGQWGLYWYAQRAGAKFIGKDGPQPERGDFVVMGTMEGGSAAINRIANKTLAGRSVFATPGGRTMSPADKAGLHFNHWGPLIWSWGWGPLNTYRIWRLE
jgi:hypothetical protein